ncbi:Copper/zinc superoxide dismutase [Fulvivirga imtechensis AK7]|uniref:Copper/zinc superoxide dismutase n=1 Tax=Fulvivirga imtechensis AK7 TaxID=1237149 RepID=L8JNM1_9BACT|nr:superoxide dismutase family protein [Fulvivirga imtechensis]ELR70440.1 Copper/zinc superoxide dismutase [Fulvivirga imtechensis AK7]
MKKLNLYFLMVLGATLAACNGTSNKGEANETETTETTEEVKASKEQMTARAQLSSASGSGATGEATFTDLGEGEVTLKLTIENATPGEHAVHLHENGDCSAPDASSAGGHWNPAGVEHGKRPVDMQFHAGDIDNLVVGEDGKGELTMTVAGWSIGGSDSTNIINKAVIVHAEADDFESQPSGAAGKRIACGVIKKTE